MADRTKGERCFCFNPRSHAGSDASMPIYVNGVYQFQSTFPRGERLNNASKARMRAAVSIHAPTRGATNPTTLRASHFTVSIHAPTRGATQSVNHCVRICGSFNPRSRAGSDQGRRVFRWLARVSIHAPARGATLIVSASSRRSRFQSTLPRGERPTWHMHCISSGMFQSTLPRGSVD